MAYVIGLATREEIAKMLEQGWEVEDAPECMHGDRDPDDEMADSEGFVLGMKTVSIYMDLNVDEVLDAVLNRPKK